MVLSKNVRFILSVILAVAAGVVAALQLGSPWTVGLEGLIIILGTFGIQAATPASVAAKIPAHIAAAVGGGLTVLVALIDQLNPSSLVQVIVYVVLSVAASLGIQVTGIAVSPKVKRDRAARRAAFRR
jgi:hypothetical protein